MGFPSFPHPHGLQVSSLRLHLPCLGRELSIPARLAFVKPPDTLEAPPGLEYSRKLQLAKAGLRQNRNSNNTTKGRYFHDGELVCVQREEKDVFFKLDSHSMGPCSVLEWVGEVVYRVQLPPRGGKWCCTETEKPFIEDILFLLSLKHLCKAPIPLYRWTSSRCCLPLLQVFPSNPYSYFYLSETQET